MSLRPQHLLYHIAAATLTAVEGADIHTGLPNLMTRVTRTAGTSCTAHHLIVGNVVAHIQYLFVCQAMTAQIIVINLNLHGAAHEDVLHTQFLVSAAYRLRSAAGDDANPHSALARQLYGIAVFDVERADRLSVIIHRYGRCRQYPIDIEHYYLYFCKIEIYQLDSINILSN